MYVEKRHYKAMQECMKKPKSSYILKHGTLRSLKIYIYVHMYIDFISES